MAYPADVARASILFGIVLLFTGCSHAAPTPVAPTKSSVARAPTPAHALATGCRATPATVYGDEPVVFEIQAPSPGQADVELLDARGGSVQRGSVKVPGEWRPELVESGDFALQAGRERVTCRVTVNRELSRASQTMR
jgi:hypothetical protein